MSKNTIKYPSCFGRYRFPKKGLDCEYCAYSFECFQNMGIGSQGD
jgi:hypothetical protein